MLRLLPSLRRPGGRVVLSAVLLVAACTASRNITAGQQSLRTISNFRTANVDTLERHLSGYRKDSEDKVLYHLEHGMLAHFREDWTLSSDHLHTAERTMDQYYTKSINRNLQAWLVNDLQLAYHGEAYEDIYLNVVNCLNYLHQEQREDAMVEVRRISHKLEMLSDRYRGLANSLEVDTARAVLEKVDEKLEDVDLREEEEAPIEIQQNSALAHFIATVLYAKNGAADDARIELSELRTALRDQGRGTLLEEYWKGGEVLTDGSYNTLFVAFAGQSPKKKERSYHFEFEMDDEEVHLDFAVPVLEMPETPVDRVRVRGSENTYELPLVEDMQAVARTMFETKKSLIYTRAVVRAFLKAGATEGAQKLVEDELGEGGGWLTELTGEAMSSAAAQADTRGWQTLPGFAYGTVAGLPAGDHELKFEFLTETGRVVRTRTRTVAVRGESDLAVAEAIYLH